MLAIKHLSMAAECFKEIALGDSPDNIINDLFVECHHQIGRLWIRYFRESKGEYKDV